MAETAMSDVRHENLSAKLDLVLKNTGLAVPVSDVCTPLADMKAALPLSARLTMMEVGPPRPFFATVGESHYSILNL